MLSSTHLDSVPLSGFLLLKYIYITLNISHLIPRITLTVRFPMFYILKIPLFTPASLLIQYHDW